MIDRGPSNQPEIDGRCEGYVNDVQYPGSCLLCGLSRVEHDEPAGVVDHVRIFPDHLGGARYGALDSRGEIIAFSGLYQSERAAFVAAHTFALLHVGQVFDA